MKKENLRDESTTSRKEDVKELKKGLIKLLIIMGAFSAGATAGYTIADSLSNHALVFTADTAVKGILAGSIFTLLCTLVNVGHRKKTS
jgi:hypothetical protein